MHVLNCVLIIFATNSLIDGHTRAYSIRMAMHIKHVSPFDEDL